MEFTDLKYQYKLYQKEIDEAIKRVLESGHFIMGDEIPKLEKSLADYVGVKYCLGVSSGTDAVLLALEALNIGPGDEVISVPLTWISPVEVIKRVGAKPVLIDIDPQTYVMDVTKLEQAITPRTKAVIAVSLYGQMPDFEVIEKLAKKYDFAIIEDGAQSFGATQRGKRSGSVATIGATSFFPTKPLGCYGDGGAVFTNRQDLYEKMFALRVHGAPVRYNHQYIGMNARLDTLQAAILNVKFAHLEDELKKRIKVGHYYNEGLKDLFIVPKTAPYNTNVFAQYVLQSPYRPQILKYLKEKQIPSAIYYPICIHEQPAYKDMGYVRGDFPCAEALADHMFSVPMHPFLTQQDQDLIINVLKEAVLQKV